MKYNQIIIGIDPGTNNMGIGIIGITDNNPSLIAMDLLKAQKIEDQTVKLKKIFDTVLRTIDHFQPDEFAIESQFFGKNVQSMLKLGRAQGIAIAAALHRNIPVFEYSPRKIKQSITGRGNASKEQVANMLVRIFNMDNVPEYLDITDAIAVATCHFFQKKNKYNSSDNRYKNWESFVSQNPNKIKGK